MEAKVQRDGPKVIHHDTITNADNQQVNRLVLDVNGHEVQVLQYDESPTVIVYVDTTAQQMDISQAGKFIADRTGEE